MRKARRRWIAVALLGVASGAGLARAQGVAAPETLHALLINGGDAPESNYLSHLHHLEDMVEMLGKRGVPPGRIHVFSADGEDQAPDLTTRGVPPPDFWILEGTRVGERLRPLVQVVDTRWPGVTLHPARQADLRAWFEGPGRRLVPGDRLLVFVTDHGTPDEADPEGAAIVLWHEKLTVRELRELLARLAPGVHVSMVMSQCFSGAFASAMAAPFAEPSGDVCGFFSTTAEQKAYGCYPEGRDRDQIGHAFHFIEALGRTGSGAQAHAEVLVDDDTPDMPLRTSDVYLGRLIGAEAKARGVEPPALVDRLLGEAWRNRAAWEPEIRLLDRMGTAFGTFSPRRLGEIVEQENQLAALSRQMSTYAETWKGALAGLQEAELRRFLQDRPEWPPRLEQAALDKQTAEQRAALLGELLPALIAHARQQAELWTKLEGFRARATRAAEARWRLEVREAVLQRMRTVLVNVAGRVLVAGQDAQRTALAGLQRCESFTAGVAPEGTPETRAPGRAPFPPLSAEVATLEEVSPSWLGVRFRPVGAILREQRGLPEGAILLDAVYPDSPAQKAGLQVGDIVLGPPGQAFQSSRELREWTLVAPRGVPLSIAGLRPEPAAGSERPFQTQVVLGVAPVVWPKLPDPPQVGEQAPALPGGLQPVTAFARADLDRRPHLLFFWATWCGPCKRAVPEVLALAASRDLAVLAISDEDADTVRTFLAERKEPFMTQVAVDPLRTSFQSFGVSGTPTLLLVDGGGVIRHRQVGYTTEKGLTVEGWRWPGR